MNCLESVHFKEIKTHVCGVLLFFDPHLILYSLSYTSSLHTFANDENSQSNANYSDSCYDKAYNCNHLFDCLFLGTIMFIAHTLSITIFSVLFVIALLIIFFIIVGISVFIILWGISDLDSSNFIVNIWRNFISWGLAGKLSTSKKYEGDK